MANVMVPQKAVELKFEVQPSTLRLLNWLHLIKALKKAPKRTAETSVYFDTDEQNLHKKGLMLRVRRIGRRHVQTIKVVGNSVPIERNEWETEISGSRPRFGAKAGGHFVQRPTNSRYHRRCTTTTRWDAGN